MTNDERTRVEQYLQEILESQPGVKVVGFQKLDAPYRLLNGSPVTFAQYQASVLYPSEAAWIQHILRTWIKTDEIYLMWEDKSQERKILPRYSPWARVVIDSKYQWIEPLWNLSHGLYIMAIDLSRFLEIMYEEGILRAFETRKVVS